MAKKPNLAAALAANKNPPVEAKPAPQEEAAPLAGKPMGRSKGRAGQMNISAWFDPPVKFALDELRLKRSRETGAKVTIRDLMAEAYNDLFKKYGMPEVAPSKKES